MNKIIMLITIMTVMITITGCTPCQYTTIDTPIKSLDLTKDVSGAFIIGTGGFSTTPKYYVYVAQDNGWILRTYDAETTRIVEDDTTYPAYIEYLQVPHDFCDPDFSSKTSAYLRVPTNTIKMNYDTTIGGTK